MLVFPPLEEHHQIHTNAGAAIGGKVEVQLLIIVRKLWRWVGWGGVGGLSPPLNEGKGERREGRGGGGGRILKDRRLHIDLSTILDK